MAIEFHCEHCNHVIKAPDDAGGRTGKCPFCHNPTYIPRPAEKDELDLAPLDEGDESRRRKAALEDAAYQRSLLHERSVPGESGRGGAKKAGAAPTPFVSPSKTVTSLIVGYVEAMSSGKLDKAQEMAGALAAQKSNAVAVLDEMSREDLSGYGLPALPKPVLLGFLKQLRQQI